MTPERKAELTRKYDHKANGTFATPWPEACQDIAEILDSLPESSSVAAYRQKYDLAKSQEAVAYWLLADDATALLSRVVAMLEFSSSSVSVVENDQKYQ